MNKIINDEKVLAILPKENVEIKKIQLQIHLKHPCGCLIIQDKSGNWLENCNEHEEQFQKFKKEGYIN